MRNGDLIIGLELYVYEAPPIDYFNGMILWREWLFSWNGFPERQNEEYQVLAQVKSAFEKIGWEGDINDGPYVFVVPNGDPEPSAGYVIKQLNNGTTYIASPVRLP